MCQAYIPATSRKMALQVLYEATCCHLFPEQLPADFSQVDPEHTTTVDIEIGRHTIEELQMRLARHFSGLEVHPIAQPRSFPSPEATRGRVLEELRRYGQAEITS